MRLSPHNTPVQVVILDHGLVHRVTERTRTSLCALILASIAARPIAAREAAEALAAGIAPPPPPPAAAAAAASASPPPPPPLARFLPLVFSPCFVFGSGVGSLSASQLAAARAGRLPPGLTAADLGAFLSSLRSPTDDLLGVVHSLGYTRGLLTSLGAPEVVRLRALARAAAAGAAQPAGAAGTAAAGDVPPLRVRAACAVAAARADILVRVALPAAAAAAAGAAAATARMHEVYDLTVEWRVGRFLRGGALTALLAIHARAALRDH